MGNGDAWHGLFGVTGSPPPPSWLAGFSPGPVVVHPPSLRVWATQADAASVDLQLSATHADKARAALEGTGRGLASTTAAVEVLATWQPTLTGLRDAVAGYGAKLTQSAAAYDAHDVGAADLFASERIVPVQQPGGGEVPT